MTQDVDPPSLGLRISVSCLATRVIAAGSGSRPGARCGGTRVRSSACHCLASTARANREVHRGYSRSRNRQLAPPALSRRVSRLLTLRLGEYSRGCQA